MAVQLSLMPITNLNGEGKLPHWSGAFITSCEVPDCKYQKPLLSLTLRSSFSRSLSFLLSLSSFLPLKLLETGSHIAQAGLLEFLLL